MSKKSRKKILYDIEINKIAYGWIWVWHMEDGKIILVKGGALPGSIVDLRITKKRKDFIQWHILEVKKQNPEYTDGKIFCDHYFSRESKKEDRKLWKVGCGGCKRQVMSYAKQLQLKENIVKESFKRITESQAVEILPIVPSVLEKNYRNKIEFSFGKYIKQARQSEDWKTKTPEIQQHRSLWFHKQWEFSKIIDVEKCWLISDKANKVFWYLKAFFKNSKLMVHDQKTHEWFYRHLVMREWINTDQLLINLAVSEDFIDRTWQQKLRQNINKELENNVFLKDNITTFLITNNNWLADVVKWQDISIKILRWNGYIFEKLNFNKKDEKISVNFRISPFSFFQTNTTGAEQLFNIAMKFAWKQENWTILDLYCGTGTIGLSFLKCWIWDQLVGIEIIEEAIEDAWKNAEINKLKDKSFFVAGPAEKIVKENEELNKHIKNLKVIILDPPREWLHKTVIQFVSTLKQQHNLKIIYISCNPVTMARDVLLFAEENIHIKKLQAVDMFPQTHHIECVSLLS